MRWLCHRLDCPIKALQSIKLEVVRQKIHCRPKERLWSGYRSTSSRMRWLCHRLDCPIKALQSIKLEVVRQKRHCRPKERRWSSYRSTSLRNRYVALSQTRLPNQGPAINQARGVQIGQRRGDAGWSGYRSSSSRMRWLCHRLDCPIKALQSIKLEVVRQKRHCRPKERRWSSYRSTSLRNRYVRQWSNYRSTSLRNRYVALSQTRLPNQGLAINQARGGQAEETL